MKPPQIVFETAAKLHRFVVKVSGGRIGWTMSGMPVIELTTIGRQSGQPRPKMLSVPWQDGTSIAVVAAAGGSEHHPAWYLNLRDNSSVTVRNRAGSMQMEAKILEGADRAELLTAIDVDFPNFAKFQKMTRREFPVVVLSPT